MEVKVVLTERAGHAVEIAEEYAREGWTVFGAGGDGTLCEVVQGWAAAGKQEWPVGDFACAYASAFPSDGCLAAETTD